MSRALPMIPRWCRAWSPMMTSRSQEYGNEQPERRDHRRTGYAEAKDADRRVHSDRRADHAVRLVSGRQIRNRDDPAGTARVPAVHPAGLADADRYAVFDLARPDGAEFLLHDD